MSIRLRVSPEVIVTSKSDAHVVLTALGGPVGVVVFMLGAVAGVKVVAVLGFAVGLAGVVASWAITLRVWPRVELNPRGLIPDMGLRMELGIVPYRPDVVRRAVAMSRRL